MYRTHAPLPVEEVEAVAAPLRPLAHAAPRRLRRPGRAGVGAEPLLRRRVGVRRPRSTTWPSREAQKAVRVGSTGVLLTRDGRGALHAFANICRHRGHELLACGATAVRGVVQCPYHAWSYELDGSLRLAPHFGDVPNFDRDVDGPACPWPTPSGAAGCS